jgi:Ca2+/Na+ antiporter
MIKKDHFIYIIYILLTLTVIALLIDIYKINPLYTIIFIILIIVIIFYFNKYQENFEIENIVYDFIYQPSLEEENVYKSLKKFDGNKVDAYNYDFFSFRNNLNMNSHGTDPVDKINEMIVCGKSNIGHQNIGIKINDIYNTLTQ